MAVSKTRIEIIGRYTFLLASLILFPATKWLSVNAQDEKIPAIIDREKNQREFLKQFKKMPTEYKDILLNEKFELVTLEDLKDAVKNDQIRSRI